MEKQPENAHLGYSDTPVLPDTGYHVHDGERPQPPVVAPGAGFGAAPTDAHVLFDGASLQGWIRKKDGASADWVLADGAMEVRPGSGDILTTTALPRCFQLHLEFASPAEIKGYGQGRGNSGIFLMDRYEIQVLDNCDNPTYADGTVGAIYGQTPPRVNSIRKPGAWNTVEIVWEGPVFHAGKVEKPAFVTVLLNGVVQHHHQALAGPTQHKKLARYEPHPENAPLRLQDHGDRVRFRNIWFRSL
ncbi:MAG: DUF1080 domain-containing protein [Opitutales bacterium]